MDGYIPTHLGFLLYGQVLTQSDLCDTIIVVSNGEIRCHSCVISMTSDRIREWLKISGVRDGKKILPMEAADLEAVYAVLKYIYTGNESFNEATIGEIIRAATIFECKLLLESCLGYFRNRKMYFTPPGQLELQYKGEKDSTHNTEVNHVPLHRVIRLAQPVNGREQSTSYSNPTSDNDDDIDDAHRSRTANSKSQGVANGRYINNSELRKYCNECKKGFATVGSYTRHLRMIHYKLKPLSCQVCHHAFYQRSDLKKHIQRQHPDEQQQSP